MAQVWVLIFASMIGSILITWWMVNAIHKYLPERFGTCPRSLLEAGTNLQFYIRIILGQCNDIHLLGRTHWMSFQMLSSRT